MAKRSRRSRKDKARQQRISRTTEQAHARVVVGSPAVPEGPSHSGEYEYVIADLKRVAILAAAMFALLIALSFFIR